MVELLSEFDAAYEFVHNDGPRLYVRTDRDAPRGKLVRLELDGPGTVWVKDETRNPTGAFKDRFHAVSVSMARHLGYAKVTSSTTGNHGTSLAAYAARAGLRCLVFVDPRAPQVQRDLIRLFGAGLVAMRERRGGVSMHRGGRAAYYAYKMALTLALLPVRRRSPYRAQQSTTPVSVP